MEPEEKHQYNADGLQKLFYELRKSYYIEKLRQAEIRAEKRLRKVVENETR